LSEIGLNVKWPCKYYIYIYIYMCVCVCVCVYIYIYIYIYGPEWTKHVAFTYHIITVCSVRRLYLYASINMSQHNEMVSIKIVKGKVYSVTCPEGTVNE
jgi:hypothetical protein